MLIFCSVKFLHVASLTVHMILYHYSAAMWCVWRQTPVSSARVSRGRTDTDSECQRTVLLCLIEALSWFITQITDVVWPPKQYRWENSNKQALKITCRNAFAAFLRGLNHPYLSFQCVSDSGEVFHKCPPPTPTTPPPCLDSLVNPAPYSLPEPIIFHFHSHFWIGNSKGVLTTDTHW